MGVGDQSDIDRAEGRYGNTDQLKDSLRRMTENGITMEPFVTMIINGDSSGVITHRK